MHHENKSDHIFVRMGGEVGFDMRIMKVLQDFNVSYINKATNANTIDVLIAEKDCTLPLVEAMRQRFELVTTQEVAIGSNIAKPARALADENINILSVSQTTCQTNMQFTMDRRHFVSANRAMHRALCEE